MADNKTVILFCRHFFPSNSGFANASTALAWCLAGLPGVRLVVITPARIRAHESEFKGATVLRTQRDGRQWARELTRVLNAKIIRKVLEALRLSWIARWLGEDELYRLALPYLDAPDTAMVMFETNLYPFLGPRVNRKVPQKTVIRLHSTEDTEKLAWWRDRKGQTPFLKSRILRFCRECGVITATNNYHIEFFKDVLLDGNVFDIWSKRHYDVIPITLGPPEYMNALLDVPVAAHERHGLPAEYCFMIGKLSKAGWVQKGFGDLIKALQGLEASGRLATAFRLVIVGGGEEAGRLGRLIRSAGLADRIIHLPSTSRAETFSLIERSKFVILPSRFEGQSVFLAEALFAGKPIVTTRRTGASDNVDQGNNGILVDIGDIEGLGSAIADLWSASDTALQRMGSRSREIYASRLSFQRVQDAIIRLMRAVEGGA